MRNFKIILQYEGTRYQGWQKQENPESTLQGRLESLLFKMCGTKIEVQGAGRTDAGVHALGQVAHFRMETDKTSREIMDYMNIYLPEDIAVVDIAEMDERFHSRLHAKGKTYVYRVINSDIPHIFDRRYTLTVPEPLDLGAMNQAAKLLCGTHDFRAFTSSKRGRSKPDGRRKSTVRTINQIKIEKQRSEICFTFYGNGFLYHMIRIIMGTLLEIGAGERKPEEIIQIMESGQRENAGRLVPAKGLTLMEVHYL